MKLDEIFKIGICIEHIRRVALYANERTYLVQGEGHLLDHFIATRNLLVENNIQDLPLNGIKKWIDKLTKYNEHQRLNVNDAALLDREATTWMTSLVTKLSEFPIIDVNKEGSLNYKKLLEGCKTFFSKPETWNQVSDLGKEDLEDSAKCLLVHLPTPSAMITLRAAEDCLRQYYTVKMDKEPPRNWKKIIDELKGKIENKPLLDNLDYIRQNLRNVAEHPDKRFTMIESERLFLLVINTIEEMFEDMKPK